MQDPRIRLAGGILLSISGWLSLTGAFLCILWWVIFGRAHTAVRSLHGWILLLIIPAVMSLASYFSGGDGVSYFFRITAVLLIASWLYAERYPGELLDIGVFFGGRRIGFEIGLIGELSMSALEVLGRETERVRIAIRQKGRNLSPGMIPAVFSGIIVRQLQVAHERAILLTLRGYQRGGTHCPSFSSPPEDWIAGAFSCLIFVISLIAGDFFMISGSTFIV